MACILETAYRVALRLALVTITMGDVTDMRCEHPYESLRPQVTIHSYRDEDSRPHPTIMTEVVVTCGDCGQRMVQNNGVPTVSFPWYAPLGGGPGTFFKKKLEASGYSGCDACYELALYMNRKGPEWCLQNADILADDILPRAKIAIEKKYEWVGKLTGLLKLDKVEDAVLRAAIVRSLVHAVEEWNAFCASGSLRATIITER